MLHKIGVESPVELFLFLFPFLLRCALSPPVISLELLTVCVSVNTELFFPRRDCFRGGDITGREMRSITGSSAVFYSDTSL